MKSNLSLITDAEFETEVLQAQKPVLVYLWADWCGPCRLVSPAVASIAGTYVENLKVVKMEVDANPETVKRLGVEGVPALRLMKQSEVLVSFEGAITKAKLIDLIKPYL